MRGIYAIYNRVTERYYVGASSDFCNRWSQHLGQLATGKHFCQKMQEDFSQHGIRSFTFEVLERCRITDMAAREIEWMKILKSVSEGYNMPTRDESILDNFVKDPAEKFIRKAFAKVTGCNPSKITITHLSEDTLNRLLPILDEDIEFLRSQDEILVIPDSFDRYRKVPLIFTEKDFDERD